MRLVQVISDYIRRSILTTQGDLVVRGAALPERLAAGAAGTYLMGQGVGVIPAYVAPSAIPACRMTLSANQSIPSGLWTKILLNGTDFDITSNFDSGSNRWVCAKTGIYYVSVSVGMADLTVGARMGGAAYLNGNISSPMVTLGVGGAGNQYLTSSDCLSLAVNDYIDLRGFQTCGVNKNVRGGLSFCTWLTLHYLS